MLRASAAFAAVLALAASVRAQSDVEVFRSRRWRVSLEPPQGYLRTGDSPYPGILARFAHESGAVLTLAAQDWGPPSPQRGRLACGTGALARFVADNVWALERSGYVVSGQPKLRGAVCRLEVKPARGRGSGRVLQAYRVEAGMGYVLTLALPRSADARASDLDLALELLDITKPAAPPRPTEPRPTVPGAGAAHVVRPRYYPSIKPWLPMAPTQPTVEEDPVP